MSKLTSIFWTTDGIGDGLLTGYTQSFLTRWQRMTWLSDPTTMGIAVGYLGEMMVANPGGIKLDVGGGACLVHGFIGWKDTWGAVYDSEEDYLEGMATDGDGIWCACGITPSKIYRSSDGGVTWAEVYDAAEISLNCIATDNKGVWCAGSGNTGKIYRSTDNGITWAEIYNSPEVRIDSMATDCNGVWCAGTTPLGKIYRSTDNGATWAEIYDSPDSTIYSMATDGGGIWCAGADVLGKIYRSTNNGVTWAEIYDSTETNIYSIASGRDGVWCAGSSGNGKIYRSTDGGATWAEIYDTPQATMFCMATGNDGVWCAGGSGPFGKIYRSTDNGATWAKTYDSPELGLYSMATDCNGVWCMGSGTDTGDVGKIYRTEDLIHNLTLPLLSNTGWRMVIRIKWDKRTMETVLLESVDGVSDIPEITQDVGVYWEISLAYGTASTMGVVTVNDNRTFLSSAGEITGDMITDESIEPIKIKNRTRTFWCAAVDAYSGGVEATWNIATGWGWTFSNGVTAQGFGTFDVPGDFVSDMTATAVIVSSAGAGGNFYIGSRAFYGAHGESWNTHDDQFASAAVANPGNGTKAEVCQITLTDAAIEDYVAMQFWRDSTVDDDTATADLVFMGWIISYTADS